MNTLNLNSVVARVEEENKRANQGQPPGRLAAYQLNHPSIVVSDPLRQWNVRPEFSANGHGVPSTPPSLDFLLANADKYSYIGSAELPIYEQRIPFKGEELLQQLNHMPREGWELFGGAHFVWGTSFCRADIKEINQMLSVLMYFRSQGRTDCKIGYFIDPGAHTTAELFGAMESDMGIDLTVFKEFFADIEKFPPSFFGAPTIDLIEQIGFPDNLMSVKELFIEALKSSCVTTLGDWRIEVDRLVVRRLLLQAGLPCDAIEVIDFHHSVRGASLIKLSDIAAEIESANFDWGTQVRRAVNANYARSTETHEANAAPIMLRMVAPNGLRIGIGTDFVPINLSDRSQKIEDETVWEICKDLQNMSLQDAMANYPIQTSGVGYMTVLNQMAAGSKKSDGPVAGLFVDDYEQAIGPMTAMANIHAAGNLAAFCMPKGWIGGLNTNGESSFDVNPDLAVMVAINEAGIDRYLRNAHFNAYLITTDDVSTNVGTVVDVENLAVEPPSYLPSRETALQLLDLFQTQGEGYLERNKGKDLSSFFDFSGLGIKQIKGLILSLLTVTPEWVDNFLAEEWDDIDKAKELKKVKYFLKRLTNVLATMNMENNYLGSEVNKMCILVGQLEDALHLADAYSVEADGLFTEVQRVRYLLNKVEAIKEFALQQSISISDYAEPEAIDRSQAADRISEVTQQLMTSLRRIEIEGLAKERSVPVTVVHERVNEINKFKSALDQIGRLSAVCSDISKLDVIPFDSRNLAAFETICGNSPELANIKYEEGVDLKDFIRECITNGKLTNSSLTTAQTGIMDKLKSAVSGLVGSTGIVFGDEVFNVKGKLTKQVLDYIERLGHLASRVGRMCDLGLLEVADMAVAFDLCSSLSEAEQTGVDAKWEELIVSRTHESHERAEAEILRIWEDRNTSSGIAEIVAEQNRILALSKVNATGVRNSCVQEIQGIKESLGVEISKVFTTYWYSITKALFTKGLQVPEV